MLYKIRLELARCKDYPEGAHDIGYEFAAPLTPDGHIDAEGWQKDRAHCRVLRFDRDAEHEVGHLIRKQGGSWAFHYDIHGDEDDDDAGYRFANHTFKPGEYVSVREDDDLVAYQVKRVQLVEID